jgi:hypothetical protein
MTMIPVVVSSKPDVKAALKQGEWWQMRSFMNFKLSFFAYEDMDKLIAE